MAKHKEIELWFSMVRVWKESPEVLSVCTKVTDTGKQYRLHKGTDDADLASRCAGYKTQINKSDIPAGCCVTTKSEALSSLREYWERELERSQKKADKDRSFIHVIDLEPKC